MKALEIISAINNGQRVFWRSTAYEVIKDSKNQFLIQCAANGHCIGLTWADGVTLNGKESDFYIPSPTQQLAREFSKVLRQTLTDDEMTEVISLNRTEGDINICHSHDFCDANMALIEAYENIYGCEPTFSDDKTMDLINTAWALARTLEFNAN